MKLPFILSVELFPAMDPEEEASTSHFPYVDDVDGPQQTARRTHLPNKRWH